jgi:formate hydrogenlyase subunit 6/NADH:ubiquinone oxidoreductase subunit I
MVLVVVWAWVGEWVQGAGKAPGEGEAAAVPWVDNNLCVGCGVCVERCPGSAIVMNEGKAVIDMDLCIRCGECHDFCPENAICHDADLAEQRIEESVRNAQDCMSACEKLQGGPEAGQKCLQRFFRHYRNELRIIDEVMKRISVYEKKG